MSKILVKAGRDRWQDSWSPGFRESEEGHLDDLSNISGRRSMTERLRAGKPVWRERYGAGEGPEKRTAMSTYERTGMGGDASDEANFDSPEEWMDAAAQGEGGIEDDEGPRPENPEDTPPMRSGPSHFDDTKFPFGMDPDMLRELERDEDIREGMDESKKNRAIASMLERGKQSRQMEGSPFDSPHQGRSMPKDWNWKSPQPMAKAWTMLKDSAKNWQFCEKCKRNYSGSACQYCIQKGTPYFPKGARRQHRVRCESCGGLHETEWHDIGRQPEHLRGGKTDFTRDVFPSRSASAQHMRQKGGSVRGEKRKKNWLSPDAEAGWTRMQDPTTRSLLQRFAQRGAQNTAVSRLPYGQRFRASLWTDHEGKPSAVGNNFGELEEYETIPRGNVEQSSSHSGYKFPPGPSSETLRRLSADEKLEDFYGSGLGSPLGTNLRNWRG